MAGANGRDGKGQFLPGNKAAVRKAPFSMTRFLRQQLQAGDGERARRIVKKWLDMAEDGDIRAIEHIVNRIDGKVAENRTGPTEIRILVAYDEEIRAAPHLGQQIAGALTDAVVPPEIEAEWEEFD